jgi:hypothetical protein
MWPSNAARSPAVDDPGSIFLNRFPVSGTNLGNRLFTGRQHSRHAAQRRARWAVEFCFGF